MYQKMGCLRAQLPKNVWWGAKTAVPLHRQKDKRITQKEESRGVTEPEHTPPRVKKRKENLR
jgi:hypothetical protein